MFQNRSSNITIQQSPLSNSNGPFSANSQTVSTNHSTSFPNYSSPTSRILPLSGMCSFHFLLLRRRRRYLLIFGTFPRNR